MAYPPLRMPAMQLQITWSLRNPIYFSHYSIIHWNY